MICSRPDSLLNKQNISCLNSSMNFCGGAQHIHTHACAGLTKIEHLGSEYPRNSSKPIFRLEPFLVKGGYCSVESCRSRQLLVNLFPTACVFRFSFPGIDFIRSFIWEADPLFEIRLDELKSFPLVLKRMSLNYAMAVPVHSVLNSSQGVIGPTLITEGDYFPIYREEGYDYGKWVVLDTVGLPRCVLPKWRPFLFWIRSNYKVCCLNMEADRI